MSDEYYFGQEEKEDGVIDEHKFNAIDHSTMETTGDYEEENCYGENLYSEEQFEGEDQDAIGESDEMMVKEGCTEQIDHAAETRIDDSNGNEYIHCLQCDLSYPTVNEFIEDHISHTVNDVDSLNNTAREEEESVNNTDDESINIGDDPADIGEEHWETLPANNAIECNIEDIDINEDLLQEEKPEQSIENCEQEVAEDENEIIDSNDLNDLLNTDEKRYFCCECENVFDNMESAEAHNCTALLQQDSNCDDIFKCDTCSRTFKSKRALSVHIRTHLSLHEKFLKMNNTKENSTISEVMCSICKTSFSSEKNLQSHMKIHNKQRVKSIQEVLPDFAKAQYNELNQFHCEICNKSFEQNLLAIHRRMHQNSDDYTCNVCNRKFTNPANFEVHLKLHQDSTRIRARKINPMPERLINAKKSYPCQYCGHVFARPFEKVKHERVHTGEKPYECEVCGKRFRVSYSLTLHLRTHTNIRPYVCPTCNKRFKSHSVYAHHLKTHQSECTYACDFCTKAFRTSVQLNCHKNTHLKPYNCLECNRPFATMYNLRVHMKTHDKDSSKLKKSKSKEFCTICDTGYDSLTALQEHLTIHLDPHIQLNLDEFELNENSADQENMDDPMTEIVIAATEADDNENYELEEIIDQTLTEEIVDDWQNEL